MDEVCSGEESQNGRAERDEATEDGETETDEKGKKEKDQEKDCETECKYGGDNEKSDTMI